MDCKIKKNFGLKKINVLIYFKNLTDKLHFLYVLKIHIKFYFNRVLFTIRFKNLFFMHNFKLQKLKI